MTINITKNITLQANPTLGSNIKNLRIEGNGFTINGANQYQFLRIPSATKVTINNISIINCYNSEGSVIYNNGTVIIRNSNLTNNTARWDGSVIYNNAGIANISGSNINYNNAEFGGAIYNNEGNLIIIGSNLNYNTARNNGGAIYKINGNLTIVASYFNNNNATGDYGVGGAIYNDGGNLSVTGCDFNNNNANYRGGAIYNTGSDTSSNIVLSTFNNNYPPNFRINNENEQFSIELNLNDGFIDVDTVAVYLDNQAECVYTGPLDGYAVPLGYIIRLVVNGSDINSFHNNTFIIRPASNVEVNNYSELVTAVNNAKSLDYNEYYISLSQGDYNATTGMTWGDASGKVIYVKVVNGTATIENYVVPTEWTRNDTTIQAIYTGSAQCSKLTSEKTQPVISPMAPSITTNDITATAGEQITFTANINDGDKQINTGKVLFKINGKTIKDASGKVLYVKVVNGIASLNYTIHSDMNAKNYNITAIFTSPNYEKLEDTKTLTVN
ncbi:Ig-like domain-containing protein [Methanosphaera sp. BMS]|uniref:Ig-like domain-containing protein n=1 Tax=Methanosphaera sp. BMS TaxID=1789762 RepID=UPI000DC1F369|nr:Ig-like domain-containing protein [Methanosphaera sp. BMS]AWX32180.1 hypothetical protein AW729_03280 [Methanosphaera sp. BMS]